MEDGCAVHWQWRTPSHEALFYDHTEEEALIAAKAYIERIGEGVSDIELRKVFNGRPGEWIPATVVIEEIDV